MENAEAEKFFLSFEKKFSEHYETISKEENVNISSEDGMVRNYSFRRGKQESKKGKKISKKN